MFRPRGEYTDIISLCKQSMATVPNNDLFILN
jgi:hypothetical protein